MLKVSQLIKFIGDLNPNQSPARLALYNYLKHFHIADDALDASIINQYFTYAFDYTHWQQNKTQLGNEIKFLLTNFNSIHQNKFDTSSIRFPQSIQIFDIEIFSDLVDIVNNFIETDKDEADKFRLINDQQKRVIAIVLKPTGHLKVRIFDKKCVLRGGKIEPLRTNMTLHYTPQLELDPEHVQRLEIAPFITAQFKTLNQRCMGSFIRGYVFQKYQELKGEAVHEQLKLFYPLKRVEQFFIDRRTDSYYQELVTSLERMNGLARQGDQEALRRGQALINMGEMALTNIFIDDKLLTLLVRDLKSTFELQAKNKPQAAHLQAPKTERNKEWPNALPLTKYDLTN